VRRLRSQRAFTLVEVLSAMTIATVVLGAGVTAFAGFLTHSTSANNRTDAQDTARLAIDQMAAQLRGAMSSGPAGNQPVESASSYSVVFLSPSPTASLTANALGLMHVRYCLDASSSANQKVWRQTAPYDDGSNAAAPATTGCPSASWPTRLEVASHLVNQAQTPATPLFTPSTDSSGNVSDIAITAAVDADPTTAPPATNLRTSITLRNLNHAPTAALTCQATGNGHVACDASTSSDPDSQTLTFAWAMDGGTLAGVSYHIDQASLASGSTHSFQVTVRDSGGLTSTATQSVTLP
jgi:prepilin-type N-terminal cleavage/methylation domain-containing protein